MVDRLGTFLPVYQPGPILLAKTGGQGYQKQYQSNQRAHVDSVRLVGNSPEDSRGDFGDCRQVLAVESRKQIRRSITFRGAIKP